MRISQEVYEWYYNRAQVIHLPMVKPSDLFLLFEELVVHRNIALKYAEYVYGVREVDGAFLKKHVLTAFLVEHDYFIIRAV